MRVPSFVRCLFTALTATVAVFLAARAAMLFLVRDEVRDLPLGDILTALYIGAKFDIRIAVFLCLPLALALWIPWSERRLAHPTKWLRRLLTALYVLGMVGVAVIYSFDFGFYFYLRQRLDTTLFELLPDFALSASMVWQTYPVLRLGLGLVALAAFFFWMFRRFLRGYAATPALGFKRRAAWTTFSAVALFLLAYAQLSSNFFPLRWSNAYFSPNRFLVILALNPVQNLRDSYVSLRSVQPDTEAVRAAYPRMAERLGVTEPDASNLNFWRLNRGRQTAAEKPNFIVIIMESLGTPRTALASGLFQPGYASQDSGPDDPAPNVRRLAEESLYFPWFFSPTRTTSRAVFTTISGIPDVNRSGGTSSRNPALVDQFSVFNEFNGYDKSYMIGGSASWANIRGILSYNVQDLRLLEEGHWKSPNTDVWGLSDLALMRESLEYFDSLSGPFISFIQTAGFHRPWTIPDDNAGFERRFPDERVLRHYGFENVDEYNSMRFSDHALGEFFRLAQEKPWFANTVFVIFGDHGLNEPSDNVPGGYLACRLQGSHVPLLFHAPGRPDLIRPGISPIPSGQPDVLPTLAELAGIPYRNHGMGRNLLSSERLAATDSGQEYQFIAGDSEAFYRILMDGHCFLSENQEALYLLDGNGENILDAEPERADLMRQLGLDDFNTAKYLLFNNHKDTAPPLPEQ